MIDENAKRQWKETYFTPLFTYNMLSTFYIQIWVGLQEAIVCDVCNGLTQSHYVTPLLISLCLLLIYYLILLLIYYLLFVRIGHFLQILTISYK